MGAGCPDCGEPIPHDLKHDCPFPREKRHMVKLLRERRDELEAERDKWKADYETLVTENAATVERACAAEHDCGILKVHLAAAKATAAKADALRQERDLLREECTGGREVRNGLRRELVNVKDTLCRQREQLDHIKCGLAEAGHHFITELSVCAGTMTKRPIGDQLKALIAERDDLKLKLGAAEMLLTEAETGARETERQHAFRIKQYEDEIAGLKLKLAAALKG